MDIGLGWQNGPGKELVNWVDGHGMGLAEWVDGLE